MQLGLRWAADAFLPQDGSVIHKGELELRLQVKVLPSTHSHRRVEDVGHKERDTEGDVGLDQIQNLHFRKKNNCHRVSHRYDSSSTV